MSNNKDEIIDKLIHYICYIAADNYYISCNALEFLLDKRIALSEERHIYHFVARFDKHRYAINRIEFIKKLLNNSDVALYEMCNNYNSCLYQFIEDEQKELIEFAIDRLRNSEYNKHYTRNNTSFELGLLQEIVDDHERPESMRGINMVADYLGFESFNENEKCYGFSDSAIKKRVVEE